VGLYAGEVKFMFGEVGEYDGDAAYGDVAPNGEALYGEVMVAIGEVGMKGDVGE
jgi:hypothetical protein